MASSESRDIQNPAETQNDEPQNIDETKSLTKDDKNDTVSANEIEEEAQQKDSQLPSRSPSPSSTEKPDIAENHDIDTNPNPDADPDADTEPSDPEKSKKEYETTTELPRDILTAYILIRLNGKWDKLTRISRLCILFGFAFSWFAQFTVFASLITQTIEDFVHNFELEFSGQDFLFNLVAICALFMYLWKDVMAYYSSVWFYVSLVEKERQTGFYSDGKKMMGNAMDTLTKLDTGRMVDAMMGETASNLFSFAKFRLFLIASFALYGGFALYSLVEIAATDTGITDKLEVHIFHHFSFHFLSIDLVVTVHIK